MKVEINVPEVVELFKVIQDRSQKIFNRRKIPCTPNSLPVY